MHFSLNQCPTLIVAGWLIYIAHVKLKPRNLRFSLSVDTCAVTSKLTSFWLCRGTCKFIDSKGIGRKTSDDCFFLAKKFVFVFLTLDLSFIFFKFQLAKNLVLRTNKLLQLGPQGSHLMFGWQKLFFQLAKGPAFRRVGLLLDGPGHAGCRLLSNPHRQPVGVITSSSWSPALGCRVAQAYVKPEYAKANKHVFLGMHWRGLQRLLINRSRENVEELKRIKWGGLENVLNSCKFVWQSCENFFLIEHHGIM